MGDRETFDSVDEMFEEMKRDFRENHPIQSFIDDLFGGGLFGLFGYAPHYSLTHPHVLLGDLYREIVWAAQRVFRGWDDKVCWSIDWWMDEIMPDILMQYMKYMHGTPMYFFDDMIPDENYSYTKEQSEIASLRWESEIWKMIAGFKASRELCNIDWKTNEERKRLEEIHKRGMDSFIKYYNCLWD